MNNNMIINIEAYEIEVPNSDVILVMMIISN